MTAGGDFYVGGFGCSVQSYPKKDSKFFRETDFFGMSRRNFAISYPIFLSNSNHHLAILKHHYQTMKTMNLGIANRNPLNIRYVKANHWLGLHPQTPNVKGFCHFTAPAYGFRAAIILIKNYMRKYGCVTPENIIRRWAPPTENNTELYIACVCGRSRLGRQERLHTEGPQIGRLVAAMTRQETGMYITPEGVDEIRRKFNV
jgi:hypothetical protein